MKMSEITKTPEFEWANTPKFAPNQKVFIATKIIGESQVNEAKIHSIPLRYMNFEGKNHLIFRFEYDLNVFVFMNKHEPTYCHERYLSETEEEAKAKAVFTKIGEFSKEEWKKAIGSRKDGSHEDSELGTCCANISEIRTMLLSARKYKGVIEVDRQMLQEALNYHERIGDYDQSVLKTILESLNLTWKDI